MSWKTIPLDEPVQVEAGKAYTIEYGPNGATVIEVPDPDAGGLRFAQDGMVTGVREWKPDADHG